MRAISEAASGIPVDMNDQSGSNLEQTSGDQKPAVAIGVSARRNCSHSAAVKPLGRKVYEAIGHLPGSRFGPGDYRVTKTQATICTVKVRDKHDRIIVQEKLDGSCVAVALVEGVLHPLGRAGWPAAASPYEQHKLFARWVWAHEARFRAVLRNGERIVGEWLAQAHGTKYELGPREPFAVFDIMIADQRLPLDEFLNRVGDRFFRPHTLHDGAALPVSAAMILHQEQCWPCDEIEGVVYRVERRGAVEFLAKYVRPDKVDGRYLPDVSGQSKVWNWRPDW